MRHTAPDTLKARIRNSLAEANSSAPLAPVVAPRFRWPWLAAAAIAIAVGSSALTLAVERGRAFTAERQVENELLASHVRSLMPGHLIDVASSNQHTVKPWFNGRVDVSPPVPNLDSLGFPLAGGRLDYIAGRPVAVVSYTRRQHVINVYSWPVQGSRAAGRRAEFENGYHLIGWRNDGIELWAVSDLNARELDQFVAAFTAASGK